MIPDQLQHVLESTGYLLPSQRFASGVRIGADAQKQRRGREFRPDALWEGQSSLRVYFKYVRDDVPDETIGTWRREIWNEGSSPLLWTVTPRRTLIYNAFGRPQRSDDARANRLETFENVPSGLERLDSFAGQLAMETGQFWRNEPRVNRKTAVDHQLLSDLGALERDLVNDGLGRNEVQDLIGRFIFTRHLVDRQIVGPDLLQGVYGQRSHRPALEDPSAVQSLFAWISQSFNVDMLPMYTDNLSYVGHYDERIAQFLLPYQFDVIPVERISSIYERFVHAGREAESRVADWTRNRLTRLSPVSLVLDEAMCEAKGSESVLDLTCGSGAVLVEALRRLVRLRSRDAAPTRDLIRSTLHEQVFGVDSSTTSVRVAALSLYLAALELDPDPTAPDALRFKPLIGRSLFVGDASKIAGDDRLSRGIGSDGRARKFDVIVGTSPCDFNGENGTEARHTLVTSAATSSQQSDSLDFVNEARKFAHEETRFGLIVSAKPFFSSSGTGPDTAHSLLQSLAPVTLVNLSNLRSWLFPSSRMPAVALFARQRPEQHHDQLTVVQVPWSESGKRTHTFEIAPSDVLRVSLSSLLGAQPHTEPPRQPSDTPRVPLSGLQDSPELLKAAAFGRHHDLLLLDRLKNRHETLAGQLDQLRSKLSQGLVFGNRSFLGYTHPLGGLPFLDSGNSRRFAVEPDLPLFGGQRAQWPRKGRTYRAPLLLVKKSLTLAGGPRLIASATDRDTVFTGDYFGATLPRAHSASAHLLAAILNSALASWFFLMKSSALGLPSSQLLISDLNRFPVPDLRSAVGSTNGRSVLEIASSLQERVPTESDWNDLDEAVFDLYELDESERVVVRDGLARTGWLWQRGQRDSAAPAGVDDLRSYARAFLGTMDAWLSARNVRRMRTEIFELPASASLRVLRFVLEERPGPSILETVPVEGSLAAVLKQIGERLNVQIADSLATTRELRVHGSNEVTIIKPSARRQWMGVRALEDANAVVAKSFLGAGT